jgi:hypothetical protein
MSNQSMNDNNNLNAILADAERVTKGAPPRHTRDQAEAAMLDLAKSEARAGEGVCDAYARLCKSDARMDALYGLALAADMAQDAQAEELAKRATRNERVWELMVKGAVHHCRPGETVEKALDRLLQTDKTYQEAYALYCE